MSASTAVARQAPPAGGGLINYDAMCRAIAAAHEVDEVKGIRDKAIAFETYAKQALNVEAEVKACEIRLRAERRCGEMTKAMAKAQGRRPDRSGVTSGHAAPKSEVLERNNISKDQAKRWEKLAEVPQLDFEKALSHPTKKPTTTGIIKAAAKEKPKRSEKAVDDGALWLWGRLLDFERDGLLARDPTTMQATMLDHMKITVRRLAPLVAAWLKRIK